MKPSMKGGLLRIDYNHMPQVTSQTGDAGGIVGHLAFGAINNCYAQVDVSSTVSGGLAGSISDMPPCRINMCSF